MDFYRISIRTFHTEKHPGKAPFAHFFSHPKRSRRRCRSSSPVALVGSVCVFFPINRVDVSLTFFAWAPNMVSCSTPRLMHGFNLSHFILQVDLFHQTFVWNQIASKAQRTSRWVILSDFVLLNLQGKHVWMKCIEMYWTVAIVLFDKMTKCLFLRWSRVTLRALFFGDVGPPRQADKCSHIHDYDYDTTITPERGPDLGN